MPLAALASSSFFDGLAQPHRPRGFTGTRASARHRTPAHNIYASEPLATLCHVPVAAGRPRQPRTTRPLCGRRPISSPKLSCWTSSAARQLPKASVPPDLRRQAAAYLEVPPNDPVSPLFSVRWSQIWSHGTKRRSCCSVRSWTVSAASHALAIRSSDIDREGSTIRRRAEHGKTDCEF